MITDRLANADLYRATNPAVARALTWVQQTDVAALPDGRYAIEDDRMFALVQRYVTKPLADGRWEAHRRYIDLQVVVAGQERIGYAHIDRLHTDPYDPERDLTWLSGAGDMVTAPAGSFILLWPEDAHMPGIAVDQPEPVTKVVIKIAVGER